jgi:hypothetical protein
VLALGVQRVGGDDHGGPVHGGEQRRETGDFVGLAGPVDRCDHHAGPLVRRREQVNLFPRPAAAAYGLAVEAVHPRAGRSAVAALTR